MRIYPVDESEIFLTPLQAAGILNISLCTLKKFIYTGKLKTLKTPGGHHRILRKDLFLLSNSVSDPSHGSAEKQPAFSIASALINALEAKRVFCRGHSSLAAEISRKVGEKLKLEPVVTERLYLAALLHNIGLLSVRENILNKQFPLTDDEYSELKIHPERGERMASSIEPIKDISGIIRQHHERFDGKGYPDGLKAKAISIEAGIISVADAFITMTAPDSYKPKAISKKEAIEEVLINSGTQFDPEIAAAFTEAMNE
ncbi:MAG: HD domain-containing protein [Candidatus Omnitrophica bacterium]|nr:HD domain-containing protein [Candidatus Omnitrophota bacterium]MDD5553449.1 HD domain-containing protein [Candidatus Omnitrophota bacterium]